MNIFNLVTYLIPLFLGSLWPNFATAKTSYTQKEITAHMMHEGCSEDSVKTKAVSLRTTSKTPFDQFAYCKNECGRSGCTFYIFTKQLSTETFNFSGIIQGNCEIQKTYQSGFFSISCESQMGSDIKSNNIYKYNGSEYQ